jgi:general stress protein YciG
MSNLPPQDGASDVPPRLWLLGCNQVRAAVQPHKETVMAEKQDKEKKGTMTVEEAGRKGGEKVASERGHEFYEEIGHKGGEKVASERGHEFYEEIGRKGGEAVSEDREHMSEIGHKGGQRVKELIEKGKQKE